MTTDAKIDLLEAVSRSVKEVRTSSVDYSFNELFDMYRQGELLINPEYQRLFRWPPEKRSRFIESLLLELPTPPIYVIEDENSKYELIDGLQRFVSYLHFRGHLPENAQREGDEDNLELIGCDIVGALNGMVYDDLPTALQIRLKRISISVEVLRNESDRRLRYHMFKRLNTGGEQLSRQEIRNATIRLLDSRFNDFVRRLSKMPDFSACIDRMTGEAKERMGPEECVLRFFAFKNDFSSYKKDIGPFLDRYLESVSDPSNVSVFDFVAGEASFADTFRVLKEALGAEAFSGPTNQFSQANYDMLTQGVQRYLPRLTSLNSSQILKFGACLKDLKKDKEYRRQTTGGGKNYAAAYRRTIDYVEQWVGRCLNTI